MGQAERIRPENMLVDPTARGQTYMPPWSVQCTKCGAEMVSYVNAPTKSCKGCGADVKPAEFKIKKDLPAHMRLFPETHKTEEVAHSDMPDTMELKKAKKPTKKKKKTIAKILENSVTISE